MAVDDIEQLLGRHLSKPDHDEVVCHQVASLALNKSQIYQIYDLT